MGQSNIDKYFSRLEEVFLELVRALHSELANQMVSGITGSQFFVLKKINEKGRMTVSEVAEELGVSLSAITALVNRLVNNSMVVRTRDQTDRRLVWLEATEQGADVVAGRPHDRVVLPAFGAQLLLRQRFEAGFSGWTSPSDRPDNDPFLTLELVLVDVVRGYVLHLDSQVSSACIQLKHLGVASGLGVRLRRCRSKQD